MFYGYALNTAETAMRKQKELPEYLNFGKLFLNGLMTLVISFVYFLPVLIIFGIIIAVNLPHMEGMYNLLISGETISTGFFVSGWKIAAFASIGLMLIPVIFYVLSGALMNYAETRTFSSAFQLNHIFKKIITWTFFIAWIISVIVVMAINYVGGEVAGLFGVVPFLRYAVSSFFSVVSVLFACTLLGQAYSEA